MKGFWSVSGLISVSSSFSVSFSSFFVVLGLAFQVDAAPRRDGGSRQAPRSPSTWASFDYRLPVASNEIKVMSYNVENLFDADHDQGKLDWEFLPKNSPLKSNCRDNDSRCKNTDWTNRKIPLKLGQLKKVIEAQGPTPDVLAIYEVENENIVGQLAQKLGYSGFKISSSPDQRGIDVAILYRTSKLEVVSSAEKEIQFPGLKTRNILAINFRLKRALSSGEIIGVFANHWPSQGKPTPARNAAAEALKEFVREQATMMGTAGYHAMLLGDFNTLPDESPNPVRETLIGALRYLDVHAVAKAQNLPHLAKMPPGTYYYFNDQVWNELDHFIVSPNLHDGQGLEMDLTSFRIMGPGFMTQPGGYPLRYDFAATRPSKAGYADHFPLILKFRTR